MTSEISDSNDSTQIKEVQQPAFVGSSRRGVVDGLLAAFDQVNSTGMPLWVSLEAPSGAGKTRIVQEFYGRLAADRQHEPAYWPPSILGSLTNGVGGVSQLRKQVSPDVSHVAGSLPAYFWWGISASLRSGAPADALAQDIRQLEAHQTYLDDAWQKLAKFEEKHPGWWKDPASKITGEGITHVAGMALEAAVGAAVPGLGLVAPAVGSIREAVRARMRRRERLLGEDEITGPNTDVLDQAVDLIIRLARPGLPVVLFIEDLHSADDALAALVQKIVTSDAAVLVVSSSWPGLAQRHAHVRTAMESAGEKLLVLDQEQEEVPAPFPVGASLAPLENGDLALIVQHYYPHADDWTLRQVVQRYENPLALELLCSLPPFNRIYPPGEHLVLSEEEINDLPNDVEDVYRSIWRELPDDVRGALTVASLGVPSSAAGSETATDLTWNAELLINAVNHLGRTDAEPIIPVLRDSSTAAGWARRLSETLSSFTENAQWVIALEDNRFLHVKERPEFYEALARAVEDSVRADRLKPDEEGGESEELETAQSAGDLLNRARLAWMLHSEHGLLTIGDLATVHVSAVKALVDSTVDAPLVVQLAGRARDLLEPGPGAWIALSSALCKALFDLGRFDEALSVHEQLRTETEVLEAAGDGATLGHLNHALVLAEVGRIDDAQYVLDLVRSDVLGSNNLRLLEQFGVASQNVGRPEDAEEFLREAARRSQEQGVPNLQALLQLALLVVDSSPSEAIDMVQFVVDTASLVLGLEHPFTVEARVSQARVLNAAGQYEDGIAAISAVRGQAEQVLGADSVVVLETRVDEAIARLRLGEQQRAFVIFHEAQRDLLRVLGPNKVRVAGLITKFADEAKAVGLPSEAIEVMSAFERVLASAVRADSPAMVDTLEWLFTTYVELGQAGEDLETALRNLIETRSAAASEEDLSTLPARNALAILLDGQGKTRESIEESERSVSIARNSLGTGHPDTLILEFNLARSYLKNGDLEIARDLYLATQRDAQGVFDDEHELMAELNKELETVRLMIEDKDLEN